MGIVGEVEAHKVPILCCRPRARRFDRPQITLLALRKNNLRQSTSLEKKLFGDLDAKSSNFSPPLRSSNFLVA